jgi:hypothetical protein
MLQTELRHSAKGLLSRNDEGDSAMRLGVFRPDSSHMSIDDVLADIETQACPTRAPFLRKAALKR